MEIKHFFRYDWNKLNYILVLCEICGSHGSEDVGVLLGC